MTLAPFNPPTNKFPTHNPAIQLECTENTLYIDWDPIHTIHSSEHCECTHPISDLLLGDL